MQIADEKFLRSIDELSQKRIDEIRNSPDSLVIKGAVYYVSNFGNDLNDGLTPQTAWRTLDKVSGVELCEGDGVLFRRGDLFRGMIKAKSGVTYAAYGVGEKPKFYGWDKNLADPKLWSLSDAVNNIWKLNELILDCGTLVFNEGQAHSRKHIPSYFNSQFVCRGDESRPFEISQELTQDLDIVCLYDQRLTEDGPDGKSFPVPVIDYQSFGELYLRCDKGNPAEVFNSIEALPKRPMIQVGRNANVTVDNLCIKYVGSHAISAVGLSADHPSVVGLHVSNCEIGWIGGSIQHYKGTDPNYPQGGRGTVTRYGNGIEIYGGCDDYSVTNCYIYQVYDAGATHQVTTNGKTFKMTNVKYLNNLMEYCVYSIEYFLQKTDGDTESYMSDIEISGNIMRLCGYGWGQQRHNKDTPAHIKSWSYENTADKYLVHDNIFDRAAYRMLHIVAKTQDSCPKMYGNTYIQGLGLSLGQYGPMDNGEPEIMPFDKNADSRISCVIGDKEAKVYYID